MSIKVLQLFHFNIKDIIPMLPKIKEQGFTHVQTAPIQPTKQEGNKWNDFWVLYQPCGLRISNSQVGSKEDLINLCSEAHKIGLNIIVDIVTRHVATSDTDCNIPSHKVDKELLPFILNKPHMDENIREQCTDYSCGMPILDVENKEYQKIVVRFLDELMECGVDMLRLDQGAKHYRLPEEGGTFISEVISKYPCYGEGIFYDKYWLDKYSEFMMVGTNSSLTNKDKGIFWVLSHDDILTFKIGLNMPNDMYIKEYDFLCSNYPNTLIYAKPFDNLWMSEDIKKIHNKYN